MSDGNVDRTCFSAEDALPQHMHQEIEGKHVEGTSPAPYLSPESLHFSLEDSEGVDESLTEMLTLLQFDNIVTDGPASVMSAKSDILSGIGSEAIESIAMLTLNTTSQDADCVVEEQTDEQDRTHLPQCCVYEGSSTKIYRLNDATNQLGGKTNAVAIKILSDQFPDETQIKRLENERNISAKLSGKCAAVRAELSSTLSITSIEFDRSRTLCLEWIPGVTLREWARAKGSNRNGAVSGNASVCSDSVERIHMAIQIAQSLSEIHEAGGVILNNVSSENIIVNSTSSNSSDVSVHIIGLGSASLLPEALHGDISSSNIFQQDLCSLGGVFFELFSGKTPYQKDCGESSASSLGEKKDASFIDLCKDDEDDDKRELYRPLRELRFILSVSTVPSEVAEFILELMGAFRLNSKYVSDRHASDGYYYKSATEVRERLCNLISDEERSNEVTAKSLGRINFNPTCVYGRTEQQTKLSSVYERVILCGGACEVVLVSGFSGTGKTAFVEQAVRHPLMQRGGHFLHVKFDQFCQVKPLGAILTAFTEFCGNNVFNDEVLRQLMITMENMIGIEGLSMLIGLIPTLGRVKYSSISIENSNMGDLTSQNRLNFVFQAFIRAITGPENPMVLFLDDLQWADEASLNLIRALLMDSRHGSMLLIESYRTNELTVSNCTFSDHLNDLRATVRVTEIEINDLKVDDVNDLISNAINEPKCRAELLSRTVYRKTAGNALLVTQFVKSLWDEGLLWFSFYSKRWHWDANIIESKKVLEDAVYLIAQKILHFPLDIQLLLKQMACLGSQTEKSTLCLLGSELSGDGVIDVDETSASFRSLDIAVHEGILDKAGSKYKFAHDQLQLATYSLISQSEQSSWHLHIGKRIISACNENEHGLLFIAVDQMNKGKSSIKEEMQRIELAELNYRAGTKAKSFGVFSSSALYFEEGINLFDEKHWNDHYHMLMKLHVSYADSEFRNGSFEKMSKALDCVIAHARSFGDKLLAYKTLILCLGAQNRLHDAINMGLEVLREAGILFLNDPDAAAVQAELWKTKSILEKENADTLMSKVMTEKNMITVMDILSSLCTYALYTGQLFLPLFVCRVIQLSVSLGVCQSTIYGFALYSLILSGKFGDLQGGKTYGKLALVLMERMKAWNQRCRVFPPLYGFVFPRTNHIRSCLEPVMTAHLQCVKTGDTEYAIINAAIFSTLSFQSGHKLKTIANFIDVTRKKAIQYRQASTMKIVLPLEQIILNFMDEADNPAQLEGKAISFKKHFSEEEEMKNNQVSCRLYLYQMRAAFMFDELELASKMASKSHDVDHIFLGKYESCELIFYDCLISFTLAHRTKAKNFVNISHQSIKKMKMWSDNAPCNCEHKLHLLEAEEYFLLGKNNKAGEKYESAILLSGKNGYIQDQALSYERAAIFYLETGDRSRASYLYGKAHDTYLEWGATSKARHLCRNSPF